MLIQNEGTVFLLKRNLILLYAITFLQGMVFYAPVAVLYRQAAGVTVLQMTVIEGISLLLSVALEIPWGIAAEKIGYRNTMVFCCLLYFVSKLIFWQAVDFGGFLLERILLSIVCAGLSGCDTALLYRSCKGVDSQKVFGLYSSLGLAGLIVSALVYSLFVGEDFRLAGLLTVFSYGAAALLALGLKEVGEPDERTPEPVSAGRVVLSVVKNKKLLLFLLAAMLLEQTHQAVTVIVNQLQYQRSGIGASWFGVILAGMNLLGLLGVFSRRYTACLGEKWAGGSLLLLSAGSCVVLALTENPVLSVVGVALVHLAFSLFVPLQTELQNRRVVTSARATELSVQSAFLNGTGAAVGVVFGRGAESSVPLAFWLGAALCLSAWCLFQLTVSGKRG